MMINAYTAITSTLKRMTRETEPDTPTTTKLVHLDGATMLDDTLYMIHPQTGEPVSILRDQLWFWSREWQTGERHADQDLESGAYEDFETLDEFMASL